jgi:hypothetical protein
LGEYVTTERINAPECWADVASHTLSCNMHYQNNRLS